MTDLPAFDKEAGQGGVAAADALRFRPGGLMRCCVATLREYTTAAGNGDVARTGTLRCNYCRNGRMRFRDGAWEWASAPAVKVDTAKNERRG